MSFIAEYIKHPRSVGTVAPSGKSLARKMVEKILFEDCHVIVEYGAGTGVFTSEFITFQYTMFKKSFFSQYMNIAYSCAMKNLPPAYVLHMNTR